MVDINIINVVIYINLQFALAVISIIKTSSHEDVMNTVNIRVIQAELANRSTV